MPERVPAVNKTVPPDYGRFCRPEGSALPLGPVVCQWMLQGRLPEQLQAQGTRRFHVLAGNFSGRIAVLLFDGMN